MKYSLKCNRVRVTLRLAVYRQSVRLRTKPLETHEYNYFQLNPCNLSSYVTSSLTRGWICRFCWSSPAQLFSGPSSASLMIIFCCLKFETPPTWRARPPYLYPPGTGWPSYVYIPRHWVPFSSPSTTCRATVEVFEPASTRAQVQHLSLPYIYVCVCVCVCGSRDSSVGIETGYWLDGSGVGDRVPESR
jgi:hypothetical protein